MGERQAGKGFESMKCACYIRVSTETQTTDNQLPAIRALCEARGWQLVKVYSEEVSAWRAGRQSEWKRCVTDGIHHHHEAIIVWALDRVSRQGPMKIMGIWNHLKDKGIKLISCRESWTETDSTFNAVLYSLIGWVAEYESQHKSERTKAGIAEKKLHGGGRRGPDKKKRKRRWLKRPQINEPDY